MCVRFEVLWHDGADHPLHSATITPDPTSTSLLQAPLRGLLHFWETLTTMSDELTTTIEPGSSTGVILLGLMKGRAHAAYFPPDAVPLATKAAGLMGLHVLPLRDEPEYRDLVGRVAQGRIFATGRGFVPFVKAGTYKRACELGGINLTVALSRPDKADEAEHDRPPRTPTPVRLPKGWDDLGPGCLCLASEGEGHGWYEVVVTDVVAEGLVVAWRDFDPAEWAPFTRRHDQLALLPPEAAQAGESPSV